MIKSNQIKSNQIYLPAQKIKEKKQLKNIRYSIQQYEFQVLQNSEKNAIALVFV